MNSRAHPGGAPSFERVLQFAPFQSSLLRRVAVVQLQEAPVGGAEVVEVVELVALVAKAKLVALGSTLEADGEGGTVRSASASAALVRG